MSTTVPEILPTASAAALPMLGRSPAMRRVLHLASKVAPTDSTVLITGETGTGKELLARGIHAHSRRAEGPFVAVNASAIPESLQESELFGHRKGAYTGASADRRGLFEEAGGGTLFLDEVGDTSPSLQVKLLRVLQSGSIRRVGESAERPVDVRVIAATNRPLDEMVRKGEFREDLFFRLNVVHLHLPPLREREGDIAVLLKLNLERYNQRLGKKLKGFDQAAAKLLEDYLFPGNVRELENVVHHAVLMAEGDLVRPVDLPLYLFSRPGLPPAAPPAAGALEIPREAWQKPAAAAETPGPFDLGQGFLTLAEMESRLIEATLGRLKRNQSLAAKKLGISRSTLWRKMKEYGIQP